MFTGILSFLGGSVFRMLWGEIAAYWNKRLDHEREVELLKLQNAEAAAQHGRNLESLRLQADLQVKVINVQAEAHVSEIEATAWEKAVEATSKLVGIAWIDGWNAIIRPGTATWSIFMMTAAEFKFIILSEFAASVCSAALGMYLADRNLAKRGK